MKNRISRLIWFAFLSMVMSGCGGSGNSGTNSPQREAVQYSSDYFGLELGFQLTYRNVTTAKGETTTRIALVKVTEETSVGSAIFKKGTAYGEETIDKCGQYILKQGDSYYFKGDWEDGTQHMEDTPKLIISNPITQSFESDEWGKVIGQEPVTVPAGTFTAWVFEKEVNGSYTYSRQHKYWFVPNLGLVKSYVVEKENEKTVFEENMELQLSAKGVNLK